MGDRDAVESVTGITWNTHSDDVGATPAEVALAWLMTRPGVNAPIASATSLEQLEDILAAADVTLPQDAHGARQTAQLISVHIVLPHKDTQRDHPALLSWARKDMFTNHYTKF